MASNFSNYCDECREIIVRLQKCAGCGEKYTTTARPLCFDCGSKPHNKWEYFPCGDEEAPGSFTFGEIADNFSGWCGHHISFECLRIANLGWWPRRITRATVVHEHSPLGVRVPRYFCENKIRCFAEAATDGEAARIRGFVRRKWIDPNILSLDWTNFSTATDERCDDIEIGNKLGIELTFGQTGLRGEHQGVRHRLAAEVQYCNSSLFAQLEPVPSHRELARIFSESPTRTSMIF